MDLKTEIKGKVFKSPLILSSGILGTEENLLIRVAKTGVGAITTKSCCLKGKEGHPNPTVLAWEHGLINAVGLTNPGVEMVVEEIKNLKRVLKDTVVIASFFGGTIEEFAKVAEILSSSQPDFLEMNASCPNTQSELGTPFALDPKEIFKLTRAVKKTTKIPLIVKLSPNVTDIKTIAKAAEEGGADVISAINSLAGMIIDIDSGKPILANKTGGVSGPAIFPIALRCVYEISQTVKIPVIGIGGVTYGNQAVQMIMAGAKAVGIGSAVYYRGINVFKKINQEILNFMKKHSYSQITDFWKISYEN